MYSYIYMYYTLKTKTIKFKTQNISIDNIKRALISCYSNISFSTIPYLLYNYNSIQTLKIMNSGNCIAMSMFLKKYLNDNYKIKSYLIPASIPKLYQDSRFLDLSHVALVIPINENEAYICDVAFYFLSPIKVKLQHNHVNESIENVGIYDNTINVVNSKMEYNTDEITFLGVGSALNDIPVNIKPYVNKLKKEWNEKLPYRPLEWKKWKPFVLK